MKCKAYVTARKSGKKLWCEGETTAREFTDAIPPRDRVGYHPGDVEGNMIQLYPSVRYQKWQGFGAAFTQSAAVAWLKMSKENQDKLIKAYFSEDGIRYNYGRMHIGSCDFCDREYSYVEENDDTLDFFSLDCEKKDVLPLIKAALAQNKEITLFASPWSAPAYMKDNGSRVGGRLKKEYYALWAKYVRKYIEGYRALGVNIGAVTVQNELRHEQTWESSVFTKEEELALAANYLAPELKPLGVKIYVYDHCRERVFDRATYAFNNCKDVDGIAFHWYSGDYFDELKMTREAFPDKDVVMSEGCVALKSTNPDEDEQWSAAEKYAHDIFGDINGGATAFCDWNLTLDQNRGPSHFRENRPCFADAPVICDNNQDEVMFQPSYYVIGQFSKFIEAGASVIGCSKAWNDAEVCTLQNPDGKIVVATHNAGGEKRGFIRLGDKLFDINLGEDEYKTFIIE